MTDTELNKKTEMLLNSYSFGWAVKLKLIKPQQQDSVAEAGRAESKHTQTPTETAFLKHSGGKWPGTPSSTNELCLAGI